MYSGELVIDEQGKITRLHKGDCASIRKDFSVQLTKQTYNGEQFKAIFLMFTTKFLRDFYNKLDKGSIPEEARRDKVSVFKPNYTGRSLATFKRDFAKVSELTPQRWLIRRRLEAAHDLIHSGNKKVSEVCFDVGFKNLSHFSKIYKEAYGVAPTK